MAIINGKEYRGKYRRISIEDLKKLVMKLGDVLNHVINKFSLFDNIWRQSCTLCVVHIVKVLIWHKQLNCVFSS